MKKSGLKKTVLLLALLLTLTISVRALAERSSEALIAQTKSILNEIASSGDGVHRLEYEDEFTILDKVKTRLRTVGFTDKKNEVGSVNYFAVIDLDAWTNDYGIGVCDIDFLLKVPDENGNADYILPDAVYWVEDQYTQEVIFPVTVQDGKVSIMLEYTVPGVFGDIELLYSNVWSTDDDDRVESDGTYYSWTLRHTPNDTVFMNQMDQDVTELYVVPSSAADWGRNLTEDYETRVVKAGNWVIVRFSGTEYEDVRDENWDIRIILEDGSEHTYTIEPLIGINEMILTQNDDDPGRSVLKVSR